MLHYRLNRGKTDPIPAPKAVAPKDVELVTTPTASAAVAASTAAAGAAAPAGGSRQKAGMLKKQLTYLSVKVPPNNRVQPALVTVTPGTHVALPQPPCVSPYLHACRKVLHICPNPPVCLLICMHVEECHIFLPPPVYYLIRMHVEECYIFLPSPLCMTLSAKKCM